MIGLILSGKATLNIKTSLSDPEQIATELSSEEWKKRFVAREAEIKIIDRRRQYLEDNGVLVYEEKSDSDKIYSLVISKTFIKQYQEAHRYGYSIKNLLITFLNELSKVK